VFHGLTICTLLYSFDSLAPFTIKCNVNGCTLLVFALYPSFLIGFLIKSTVLCGRAIVTWQGPFSNFLQTRFSEKVSICMMNFTEFSTNLLKISIIISIHKIKLFTFQLYTIEFHFFTESYQYFWIFFAKNINIASCPSITFYGSNICLKIYAVLKHVCQYYLILFLNDFGWALKAKHIIYKSRHFNGHSSVHS